MEASSFFALTTLLHKCTIMIITIFTTLANHTLALDPHFEDCAPKTCGNGLNISYPFWIYGKQQSYCGYPNFEITCDDEEPVLNISNEDYIIKDIFYTNNSLLVASAASYDYEEDICPTPLHNLSLSRTPFDLVSADSELFFFYNCTKKPPDYYTYPIDCASNFTHYSFAGFHVQALLRANYSLDLCRNSVFVPVDVESGINRVDLWSTNYTEVLRLGFLLNWTTHNCTSCEASGGRCGFKDNKFVCFCADKPHVETCYHAGETNRVLGSELLVGIVIAIGGLTIIFIVICIFKWKKNSSIITAVTFWKKTKNDRDLEAFIRNYGSLAPKRYSFLNIKKITDSFKNKLGQGGYGSVYKGKLQDGQVVAVKLLNTSKGNGQEFINEVASIGRTSHVNVVRLLGFCLEGSKRALIYEFMPNGSLEKFIHSTSTTILKTNQHLGWEKLYQIALGIGRGLEYLHRGCSIRILHFDIKPHNILLDEDFCPKIADFGLAKLCLKKESNVSLLEARGTIGYIAPEIFNRNFGEVSHKSDVYSYGMMVLEMVGGRKNLHLGVENSSEIYFPKWIYKHLDLHKEIKLQDNMTSDEHEIAKKMIIVGLWCIQTLPPDRPSMNKVIDMLQGSIEALQIPPDPFHSSSPRPTLIDSSTISIP